MEVDRNYLVSALRACANEIYDKADIIIGNKKILGACQITISIDEESCPSISINRKLKAFTYITDLTNPKAISN